MGFIAVSICAVLIGLLLVFMNFFKYDKEFRCDWKRHGKFFKLTLPAVISLIFATTILIGIILFVSLSFLLEPDAALTGVIIFSIADLLTIGIIKILFLIIDRVRYNLLLTRYIKKTFNVEKNNWLPENPIKAEDAIFNYKDIKKRIAKIAKTKRKT